MEVPNTTGGVVQITLDDLLNDDIMGGKPRSCQKLPHYNYTQWNCLLRKPPFRMQQEVDGLNWKCPFPRRK
jgi:hypothetical protein